MIRLRRHGPVALLAVLLVAVLGTGNAFAGDIQRFRGDAAFAGWFLEDAFNTALFVSALDGTFQSPPGRPADTEHVAIDLFQAFCDEAEDEQVFRSFFGFAPPRSPSIVP